jgi:uncharacterized protein YbjQ (UPF0145 family)
MPSPRGFLTTTENQLSGYRIIERMGVVRGIAVRSRSVFGLLGAKLQQLAGGEISILTELCEQARADAFALAVEHAEALGANALVAVRYDATEIMSGVAEVLCYGTAMRAVSEVIRYDKHGSSRGFRGLRVLGTLLRSRGYQRVYLPHRSVRSALLALWSGAPERVGFAGSPAALTYTRRVRRASSGHEVERLLTIYARTWYGYVGNVTPETSLNSLVGQEEKLAQALCDENGRLYLLKPDQVITSRLFEVSGLSLESFLQAVGQLAFGRPAQISLRVKVKAPNLPAFDTTFTLVGVSLGSGRVGQLSPETRSAVSMRLTEGRGIRFACTYNFHAGQGGICEE